MLTEAEVRTAVANAIQFVNRTREPYGLLFMDLMHRRFEVPQFADALERYDEVLAEGRRRRRCCACCGASATPTTRFAPTTGSTCRSTRTECSSRRCIAIGWAYPRRSPKPSPKASERAATTPRTRCWPGSGFRTTAARCRSPRGSSRSCTAPSPRILEDRPTLVNDLKLEAAAFLCLARQGARVNPSFVQHVVAIQKADGGWGKLDNADAADPDGSSWHSSILALLLLLHVSFPGAPNSA